jgi:hypothetical protein
MDEGFFLFVSKTVFMLLSFDGAKKQPPEGSGCCQVSKT